MDIGNQLLSMSQEAGQAVVAHTVLAHWGTIWVRGQKKRCCLLGHPRQGAQATMVLLCRRWPGIAVLVTHRTLSAFDSSLDKLVRWVCSFIMPRPSLSLPMALRASLQGRRPRRIHNLWVSYFSRRQLPDARLLSFSGKWVAAWLDCLDAGHILGKPWGQGGALAL